MLEWICLWYAGQATGWTIWSSILGSAQGFPRLHNVSTYRAAFGPNQPPIRWVPWVLSQGVMCVMICRQCLAAAVRTSEQGVRTALF